MSVKITRPISIIGCNNSGTTILRDALLKHPDLSGPTIDSQELPDLPRIMTHFLGDCTSRLWAHPKFKLCLEVTDRDYNDHDGEQFKSVLAPLIKPGTRLVIKGPGDTLRVDWLQRAFPDVYFIALVRNGYAVTEGTTRKRKFDPERPQLDCMFTTVEEAAEHWFRANVIILSKLHVLKNCLIVRYEDLVNDPERVLYKVLDFCQLRRRGFEIPTFETDHNEKQIARLTEGDLETITRIAQPMLLHFGYKLYHEKLRWIQLEQKSIQLSG